MESENQEVEGVKHERMEWLSHLNDQPLITLYYGVDGEFFDRLLPRTRRHPESVCDKYTILDGSRFHDRYENDYDDVLLSITIEGQDIGGRGSTKQSTRYLKPSRFHSSIPIFYIYTYTATPLAPCATPRDQLTYLVNVWMELMPGTLENYHSLRLLAIVEPLLVSVTNLSLHLL